MTPDLPPVLPGHLPPFPAVPEGHSHWEYRGLGWLPGHPVIFAYIHEDDVEWKALTVPHKPVPVNFHYLEAIPIARANGIGGEEIPEWFPAVGTSLKLRGNYGGLDYGTKVTVHAVDPSWIDVKTKKNSVFRFPSESLKMGFFEMIESQPTSDPCESESPKPEEGEVINYKSVAGWLYNILDDIDSVSDHAKSDNQLFREKVEELQRLKNEVGHSPDGQTVVFNNPTQDYGLTRIFSVEKPTPPKPESSNKELCQWLRDNSSGIYRQSACAADVIEGLESDLAAARAALEDMEKKANWNRQIRDSLVKLFKDAGWQDDCTLIEELTNMNFEITPQQP